MNNTHSNITGLHHVTAISSGVQSNLDFYGGILGLKLVKQTVNFEAPEVYHLYFGDEAGSPGSILTFFPYEGLIQGRQGKGMVNTTAFSVAFDSLDFWMQRLEKFHVPFKKPQERFAGEVLIYFEDNDGLGLELVFNNNDTRAGTDNGFIPHEHSIKGLHNVEIWTEGYEKTAPILTGLLGHQLIGEQSNRFRFATVDSPGAYVDLVCTPDRMRSLAGSGTVHHVAFAVKDLDTMSALHETIKQRGMHPTEILNRNYFSSMYFREPGGVLFEVATTSPGFLIDETKESLGTSLQIPPQFEAQRTTIESKLHTLTIDLEKFR